MNKEQMLKYVELMNRYEEYKNTNIMPKYTEEEMNLISEVKEIALNQDESLKKLIIELDKTPVSERNSKIEDYFKEEIEMSQEELLIKYVDLLNRHVNSIENISKEEQQIIKKVNEITLNNEEIKNLVLKLETLSPDERKKELDKFLNKALEPVSEEEEIAKTFGVSVDSIGHKFLDNGEEVFSFYDPKLGRQVILENMKNGVPLVEQLKKVQQSSRKYQTNNEMQNANDILNDSNIELKMITLNEIKNHQEQIQNMSKEQYNKLNYLINNYSRLKIKGINLDNLIYLDENNNLIEVIYDRENDMIITDAPKHASYNEEQVENNDEKVLEEEKLVEVHSLDEYDRAIEKQENNIREFPKKEDKPKVKVKKAGFINAFLLFLLTGFVGGVLATVVTLVLSR